MLATPEGGGGSSEKRLRNQRAGGCFRSAWPMKLSIVRSRADWTVTHSFSWASASLVGKMF
eukprot:4692349-Alexandrium_andersonii.AAC.1